MKLKYIYIIVLILLLNSCITKIPISPIPKINNVKDIKTEATEIYTMAEKAIKEDSLKYYKPISLDAQDIIKLSDNVDNQFNDIIKINEELNKRIDKYNSDLEKSKRNIWLGMIGLGALGIVSGVFLLSFRQIELGTSIVAASAIIVGISYFILSYWWLLALLSGLSLLSLITFIGFNLYKKSKTITELVKTAEKLKNNNYNSELKVEINKLQSPETQKIVKDIRQDVK